MPRKPKAPPAKPVKAPKPPSKSAPPKPGKHPGGRPKGSGILLTEEVKARILLLIQAGNYVATACGACGISEASYFAWKLRGEKGEEPYASFLESLKRAEEEAEAALVLTIKRAGGSQWQAAMTLLERRHPKRWGRFERIEHSENLEDMIAQLRAAGVEGADNLTAADVMAVVKEISKGRGAPR